MKPEMLHIVRKLPAFAAVLALVVTTALLTPSPAWATRAVRVYEVEIKGDAVFGEKSGGDTVLGDKFVAGS